ncbi:hydrocephalus-inducing protein homolog isoform X2 [Alosa sapidissima]|uniref:hydrocephalus-inducing protein homolog isoform X2 n=1 Tax=Alosa sapidissima TaxID=34773 RepID=UPI001C0815E0|nr:hydrocephalus-inducing protein homolog isoform X2 [Alosa sapidissima]
MPTSKVQTSNTALQSLPLKMTDGPKSKVVAKRNPKLVKRQEKTTRMTPSVFAKEMSLSTEERLANTSEMHLPRILELLDMSKTTHQKASCVDVDQPMFQPYPSEIVFQNYTPSESYEVPLVLRNNDKIPRLVKVVEEDSLYFKVVSPVDVCNKVAPGMASTFTVLFTPQENKDYLHRVICVTEREKFEVPIRAVGARAILDFPDQLHFPISPVKCTAQRTLLVRNIGNCEAKFQLSTCSPFSVDPPQGTLGVAESMQITVDFLPKTTGDHTQELLLHYHTGEDVYISLYGAATDANVRLERNSVLLEKTYISMANQRSVAIVNRSDAIVHYQWKSFATEEEEEQHKQRFCVDLQLEEDDEMEQFLTECGADPTARHQLSLLSRTFQERRRQLRDERLAFTHQHIIIEPLEGDVWPNSTAEVNIVFKPQEAKLYQQTVYCDITGRESRLPLRIKGEGIGPKLQFNFDLLDMGNIFIGSKHSYEVLLTNKGLIAASYRVLDPSSALGLCFSFSPVTGRIPPGDCHALEVTFSSSTLGAFSEDFYFAVEGNPLPLVLTFRGCVMGPTFHFSIPELNFGEVSFGFPQTLTCCLTNTSLVPMTFDLRVPGDGTGPPSITSAHQVSHLNRTEWLTGESSGEPPTEFSVVPSSGTVRAQGQMDLQVTLCSNTVRSYSLALVVDVQGVGEDVLALPIHARCSIPEVTLESPSLRLERCFLDYAYEHPVKLINNSDLPACYGLLSQEYEEHPSVLYSSPHPRGVIPPHGSAEIPLVLQVKALGPLDITAHIAVLGSQSSLALLLSCLAEGPVIRVASAEVDFGSIPVLTDVPRPLQLSNRSPIPARFLAQMARRKSVWRVEPSEGVVPPLGELEVRLVVHLDDSVPFQDKLLLSVQDSHTQIIAVSARGKGSTIITDRPFAPSLDLGDHFSSGPCQYHFRLTNRGRRYHQLFWTTEGQIPFRRRITMPKCSPRDMKARNTLAPEAAELHQVFSLRPMRMELAPGQSADMVLEGSSAIPKVVQETLVCYGIVGHQSGKERVMTVDVSCRFIAPVLSISSQELHFYVQKTPGVSLVPLYQKLVLTSVSSLALSFELSVNEPFGLCENSGDNAFIMSKSLVLGVGARTELWVRFDPLYRRDQVTRVAEDVLEIRYHGHPQRDLVVLKGEVHFPNLQFSSTTLDFGCVLNHTESQQHITMTNSSPLPVFYRWAFLLDHKRHCIRFAEGASQTRTDPSAGEETQHRHRPQHEPPHKHHNSSRVDSNRELATPKQHLDNEDDEEKKDPENETKEGRGSPKECVPAPPNGTPTNTPISFTHRKLVQFGRHSPQWPSKTTPGVQPNIGVEEVFDILPIYGQLQPGESQPVAFSFFGHANISSQVLALCEVEGGPTYEITLKGEASLVTYTLDTTDISLGPQLFDRVAEAEIVLRNTGRVGFGFSTLPQDQGGNPDNPPPGQPLVIPSSGHIEANTEQRISVYYLPGVPEVFHKTFQLQVAFFELETISLRGEGIFPRVCLDLPRDLDELKYGPLLKVARENVENEKPRDELLSQPPTVDRALPEEDCCPTYDALLQMEVERLLVKENAVSMETTPVEGSDVCGSGCRKRRKLSKFTLPDYILDFGYVIHGKVLTHIVKVTNTGPCQVSFKADRRLLAGTGFSTELDKVKNLPYCETETFEVKFDPRGANLDLGQVNTVMPIQVAGGPLVQVRLHAVVTMPSLNVSTETLMFDSIQCGLCQLLTLQLHNQELVPCEWSITEEERPKKKIDKHIPLHLRRKLRLEYRHPPVVFEVLPSSGVLLPGDRLNVQVKFSPAEGRAYSQNLVLSVAQSTQRILLLAQGKGEEPQLEFSTSVLDMGPVLSHSAGEEIEVLVRNPCPFPVEFYSLEFDKQYLEEERVLRVLKGYDAQNVLLLPPRAPGEGLPPELLEHYKELHAHESHADLKAGSPKNVESPEEERGGSAGLEENQADLPNIERHLENDREVMAIGLKEIASKAVKDDSRSSSSVGELETNPVSMAIARHLGIDLTPDGHAARNRRGITIIVHGAPLSGKTPTAVALARHYGAACLSLDAVLLEAMASGATPAAMQARELCARAAQEHYQRKAEEMAQAAADTQSPTAQASGVLSVEAVAKHTGESMEPKAQASSISTRQKATTTGGKRTERVDTSPTTANSQVEHIHRPLIFSVSQLDLMSCLLPEEVLVDILAERLQLSDCLRGVVIDGLDTLYCRSPSCMLHAVLKALNNRRFIYMVNLSNNFQNYTAKEKAQREVEEAKQREEEEKAKLRLQEMDEEEYDALTEEEKEDFDRQRLQMVRERKRRERERMAREQEERRLQEELERQREEEEMRKKGKKGKKDPSTFKEDAAGKKSQLGWKQSSSALRSETRLEGSKDSRKMSLCQEGKDVPPSLGEGSKEAEDKKKKNKETKAGGQEDIPSPNEELDGEVLSQSEKQLQQRFQVYEHSQAHLCHVLHFWDRAQGLLLRPFNSEEDVDEQPGPERQAVSGKKTKKEREKERHDKDRLKADSEVKSISPDPSRMPLMGDPSELLEREGAADAVPHIVIPVSGRGHSVATEVLQDGRLPSLDEVLDGLGLGPKGPPIPPPSVFSVVPYPSRRSEPSLQCLPDCFTFLRLLSPEDLAEEKKEAELEAELQAALLKEEAASPAKGKSKKVEQSKENLKEKRRPASKKGPKTSDSHTASLDIITPLYDVEHSNQPGEGQQDLHQRLTNFRWIVPANGEVTLKLWFHSAVLGTFKQTLNFEVMGTKTLYQLHCQGICAYPDISRDHKVVFANSKKIANPEEVVQKAYIVRKGLFDFGPLLCGKTRDRYKERKYPENMERLVMHNNSPMEAEIHFCFQHDTKATTYLLDPPTMTLKPKEKKELVIWAYPITPGQINDNLVCCVKDNPDPAVFRLSCHGVRPELDLERKHLHFDKILLHRKETRNLLLRNTKTLPVAWRLSGMEVLGDEFSVSQDQGIILPHSEFCLQMHFRAVKPVNLKRAVRLEVSDADGILGIFHTENIQVSAEAYDVALDITFPKGADGGLDFGTVKVSEEVKLSVNLKNKGKYDIAYKFVLEPTLPELPYLNSAFTILPQKGTLHPTDRPTGVQFVFRCNKEVRIEEQPILRCQVIEPNISNAGETIAIIPIKVSVLSVFSKYSISPSSDINFGPLVYGSRNTRSFSIENKSDFEVRFHVSRFCKDIPGPVQRRGIGKKTSQVSHSAKPITGRPGRSESIQKDSSMVPQTRLTTGVFSLSACYGVLSAGATQVVTVECVAEQPGLWQEFLAVDISDRNPLDNPGGIPYQLVAEVCMPGIIKDISSIFEEHHICKNSNMLQCEQFRDARGVYVEDENKFVFNNVIVGQSAKARFRLTNSGKVPCAMSLSAKSVQTKSTRTTEVFELLPSKMCLPSHSHAFAVITFTPPNMQSYHGSFEVTLEGASSVMAVGKTKLLVMDLLGDGNLPCVSVLQPVVRNSRGQPVLQFKRLLVGRQQTLPLVIKNTGYLPAKATIELQDKMGVFKMKTAPCTSSRIITPLPEDESGEEESSGNVLSLDVSVGQQAAFEVEFCPGSAQSFEASIRLMVADNLFEETEVQLLGESYQDIVTLDNIISKGLESTNDKSDHLHFGDCHVAKSYQATFTMTNLSGSDVLRFEWPPDSAQVCFSPRLGHLHAGCAKDVTVTFCSKQPIALSAQLQKCRLCRIVFQQPVDQVADWDDRQRTVKWVDTSKPAATQTKKVIEIDPEPSNSVVENSSRELKLLLSAVCDYAKFTCDAEPIHFKDTMLYQTRVYKLQMSNKGTTQMDFSWQIMYGGATISPDHRDVPSRSGGQSRCGTALRPCSSLGSVSSMLLGDPELPPFCVEPSVGTIGPRASQTFSVRFSPIEVAEYEAQLVCSIPNLKDEQGPTIQVRGRSLLPYCHFHLEESDYITGNRRNPELWGPQGTFPPCTLDASTRVIEFTSIGVGPPTTRQFSLVNPTNKPYSYEWRCVDDTGPSPFKCRTPNSSILPGKKVEVIFDFCAVALELVESFWTFQIPERNISVPFLLVGTARDPVVYFDRAHLNMGCLLIGRTVQHTLNLVNKEKEPFQFAVQESSCYSEGFVEQLQVEPMQGTVSANDKLPVVVTFRPSQAGEVAFNLAVSVQRKVQPTVLNMKAECYSMSATVKCEDPEGHVTNMAPNSLCEVDFKQVELSDKVSFAFLVSNPGLFSLDIHYQLWGPPELQRHLQVEPEYDTVTTGKQSHCTVSFYPQNKCVLRDVGLNIKIKHGPVYSCALRGVAEVPGLDFSFRKHNFGKNFIFSVGMTPASKTLVLTNRGERGISVDCSFTNTPFLKMDFHPKILPPGGYMDVPITFYPREAKQYHEKLVFGINECIKQVVEILGQGTEIKLDFEDPRQKVVNLGSLQVGQRSRRVIPLINNSASAITFCLQLNSTVEALQDAQVLSVSPSSEMTVRGGGGRCAVELLFTPRERMAPFSEELLLECLGMARPLLVLRGCCHGVEVKLDQDYLTFGAVVQRCQATKCILMQNTGDIGTRFQWDAKSFLPDFSISPVKGYLCPGMEVSFKVTFAPTELCQDLRYEDLTCTIEGSSPMSLTLTGSCIVPPTAKEVMNFTCQVRSQHTQPLTMSNNTNQRWTLKPVIEGQHWTGAPNFIIEPYQQNKVYEVIYKPMVMTTDGKKHQGSIFFPIPDGTGMLYTLVGTAESPKSVATISHELPCKTTYTEVLPVHNWLPRPQRFRVLLEMIKPERPDSTISLKGLDYVDVSGLATKDYKISFFTYKEGVFHAKVTFRNEVTGEYLFYLLSFKATPPGVISTIEMTTPVRQVTSASVKVENPLSISLYFTVECRSPDVSLPSQLSVPAMTQGTLTFEYQPLRAGESTARLVLHSSELGYFHYDLQLKALPPPQEKPLYFHAPLGSGVYMPVKFTNYSRVKAEYTCKTDLPDFVAEKLVNALPGFQAGIDTTTEVYFEPCQLGEVRGLLTLSSAFGGEYAFPLHGTCTPPKAQGPFNIRAGSNVSIPFKNIFLQTTAFSFQVDNPAFTVKGVETIRPKKTHNILVAFDGPLPGARSPCSGKLIISSPRIEGQPIAWVFYLKGNLPDQALRDKSS